jgi:hypothetical protein
MAFWHVSAEEVGHRIAGRLAAWDGSEAFGERDLPGVEARIDVQTDSRRVAAPRQATNHEVVEAHDQ